jgi:hypothetical protein
MYSYVPEVSRRKSAYVQVGVDYTCGHCRHIHSGVQFETQTPNTLETDQLQRDRLITCVIAQQHPSATFVSLGSLPQKQIRRAYQKIFLLLFSFFILPFFLKNFLLRNCVT